MNRPLVVLGATGSIGRQTLDVAARLGLSVSTIAALRPSPELSQLAGIWPDASVVVAGGETAERREFGSSLGGRVSFGSDAVVEAAGQSGLTVVNGIVGAAGLAASVAALLAGNRLALANKESLVAGGEVVLAAAARGGGELIPVDSEHSAIFQCMVGEPPDSISKVVLTASGGPFFGRSPSDLASVTPAEALAHPTWDMGPRVTVDSATLMNKGLEVIEAHHLFGVEYTRIDVVVHRQSIVHSMVEFVDGSTKAQVGAPDMRVPIQYAITFPERAPGLLPPFEWAGQTLEFFEPDRESFPALDLAYAAGEQGGTAPAVLNAADEIAVGAFLEGKLTFPEIVTVVERTLERFEHATPDSVSDVLTADRAARQLALSMLP